MFILQRVQDAQMTFTAFPYRSDLFADVRSNYGLSESEFMEFLVQTYFERVGEIYLVGYEGELPEPESSLFSKAALQAQAQQLASRAFTKK